MTRLSSGREIAAGYDPVSAKLLTASYPEGAVQYGYADNTDRIFDLTRTGTDNSVQRNDYDYDGFLTTKAAFSGAANGEYRFAYDNNFWVTGVALDNTWNLLSRDNDGLLTGYGPFTIGRGGPAGAVDNVSDTVSRVCGLDNTGLPAYCEPGTLGTTYGYDPYGRLNRKTVAVNGTPIYEQTVALRDPAGRIRQAEETAGGNPGIMYSYEYDVDGQLFEVRRDGILVEQYGYDNNANRTGATSPTFAGAASYNDQDRLIEQGGLSRTFDDDGFLARRGSDAFQYSARGELLSATTGGQTISCHYDAIGRRVARTDAAGTTQYLYGSLSNPFQVTASRAPDNALTVYYYDDFGALYALERGTARYYVGSDHLGTPKLITDNTGNIVRVIDFDSWGVKTGDTNPGFDLPIGFAGGIPDDATGLVRFGWRDYEPGTGRWTARDPIYFKSGQYNLFGYASNDPVNSKDPSGLVCPLPRDVDPIAQLENLYYYTVNELQDAALLAAAINAGALGAMAAEYGFYFVATHPQETLDFVRGFGSPYTPPPNWYGAAGSFARFAAEGLYNKYK